MCVTLRTVIRCSFADFVEDSFRISMLKDSPLILAPSQSRPMSFSIFANGKHSRHISIKITFKLRSSSQSLHVSTIPTALTVRDIQNPHRFTFLHPSGIVSYAIIRPPPWNTSWNENPERAQEEALPTLVNLHGAGVEADSGQVRHSLDAVRDIPAWVLFPSGVTAWSGDDWRK